MISIFSLSFYILFFIFNEYYLLYSAIILGLIVFILNIKILEKIEKKYLLYLLISYCVIYYNNQFISGKAYLPIFISSLGVAIDIVKNKSIHSYFSKYILYLVYIYFYLFLITEFSLDNSLYFSTNHISTLLLFLLLYYYFVNNNDSKKDFLIFIVLYLLLTCFAANLSGFFSGILLLFGWFYLFERKILKRVFIVFFIVFFITIILVNFLFLTYHTTGFEFFDKFSINNLYNNNLRILIWGKYFELFTFKSFLLGNSIEYINNNIGNLHNSILLLHAKVGILAIYPLYLYFKSLYYFYSVDKVLFFILLAVFFRLNFDTIGLHGGFFEWIILSCILKSNFNEKKS